jgi:hypothetical protein
MAKANRECAPTQTGSVICCPLEAVDIECRPLRADRLSKRAEETTSGTWRSPALKLKSATRSRQRTITSTPNIILGLPRAEKERKTLCRDGRL